VESAAQPIDVERRVARAGFLRRENRSAHTWREQRQIGVSTAVERQVDDLLRIDDLAAVARFGFELRRRVGDQHRVGHRPGLERKVYALARVDRYLNVVSHGFGESLRLRYDLVRADLDVEKLIISTFVGLRCRGDPGGDVFQSYSRF